MSLGHSSLKLSSQVQQAYEVITYSETAGTTRPVARDLCVSTCTFIDLSGVLTIH